MGSNPVRNVVCCSVVFSHSFLFHPPPSPSLLIMFVSMFRSVHDTYQVFNYNTAVFYYKNYTFAMGYTNPIKPPPEKFQDDDNLIALNTAAHRHYLPFPDWPNMTGRDVTNFIETNFREFPMVIDDFAIVPFDTIINYDISDTGSTIQKIEGTTDRVKVRGCVVSPLERIPKRVSFARDDKRTLAQMGFDKFKHALQIYPNRLLHPQAVDEERILIEDPHRRPAPMLEDASSPPPEPERSGVVIEELPDDSTEQAIPYTICEYVAPEKEPPKSKNKKATQENSELLSDDDLNVFIKSLMNAQKTEDLGGMRLGLAKGRGLLNKRTSDGSGNIVVGGSRRNLQKNIKHTEAALATLQESIKSPEDRLEWRERRRNLHLCQMMDSFTQADYNVISGLLIPKKQNPHWARAMDAVCNTFGPIFHTSKILRSVIDIFDRKVDALQNPKHLALTHLAFFLFLYEDAHIVPIDKPSGWVGCVQRMGAALFALLYPEQAANKETVSVQSGMPVDMRRDDEQFILHFFFEPSGEAKVVLLSDYPPCQRKLVYPPVAEPNLAASRIFWVSQDYYNDPADISMTGAAFLSYKVINCADIIDFETEVARRHHNIDSEHAEKAALEWIKGGGAVADDGLFGDGDIEDARWIVSLARENKKALFGFFNYGLQHPQIAYATCDRVLKTDDQHFIEMIEKRYREHSGKIELTPPPCY